MGTGKGSVVLALRMQGHQPTIKDIYLDLGQIVETDDLLCGEESLSPDAEEEQEVFKIDTHCENCKTAIRVCVQASAFGIRCLQLILAEDLSFICPDCSRRLLHHGRSH